MVDARIDSSLRGTAHYMVRRRNILFVAAATVLLTVAPTLGGLVNLAFHANEIIGVDWALAADGFTNVYAFAGHGYIASSGASSFYAQTEFQISGEVRDIFDVGPSLGVNFPLQSGFPEFNMFWLTGSSSRVSSYDSVVRTNSGLSPPPVALANWTIDVLPTGDDLLGTPTLIDIHATFAALLTASGNGSAAASWFASTDHGTLYDGSALLANSGSASLLDQADTSFLVPLGGSFELQFRYELMVEGVGQSMSRAEILGSSIDVTATIVPEPSTLALLAVGVIALYRKRR